MNVRLLSLLMLLFSLGITSCQKIYLKVLGIKKPRSISLSGAQQYLGKVNIKSSNQFFTDSGYYYRLNTLFDTSTSYGRKRMKEYLQPIRAVYFSNDTRVMVAAMANCDAGGKSLLKMTWNYDNKMETFPPDFKNYRDTIMTKEGLIASLVPFNSNLNAKETAALVNQTKYTVFIFWSRFVGKNCQRLLNEVNTNLALNKDSVTTIWVNMDNFYAHYTSMSY